jgi:hypothetical protein
MVITVSFELGDDFKEKTDQLAKIMLGEFGAELLGGGAGPWPFGGGPDAIHKDKVWRDNVFEICDDLRPHIPDFHALLIEKTGDPSLHVWIMPEVEDDEEMPEPSPRVEEIRVDSSALTLEKLLGPHHGPLAGPVRAAIGKRLEADPHYIVTPEDFVEDGRDEP